MDANTAMTLGNVTVSDKLLGGKRKSDFRFHVCAPLDEIMWKVVVDNPTWEFRIQGYANDVFDGLIKVKSFIVLKDGEQIGVISNDYRYSRGGGRDCVFSITSNAIKQERERRSSYQTADAKKALAAIKKTFVAKSLNERIAEASKEAGRVIAHQSSRKHRMHVSAVEDLAPAMRNFALIAQAREFESYLEMHNKSNLLKEVHETMAEMMVTKTIETEFSNDTTSLVFMSNGKYVVKTGDNVQVYDDNTFPQSMRGKLGMLKLVEPEQMIEGVGCRATMEVFVLMTAPLELA